MKLVLEQVVDHLWKSHVLNGNVQPDQTISGRRDFLKDYRTWPVSTRLEVLFQKGILPESTYIHANIARKARNDLVHSGNMPVHDDAEAVLDGVFELIGLIHDPRNVYVFSDMLGKYKKRSPRVRVASEPTEIRPEDIVSHSPVPPVPGDAWWGDIPFEPAKFCILAEDMNLE